MILIKAQAVCDGFYRTFCPDNATCDIELRLREINDDAGGDYNITHLQTVVHSYPKDWLISGDYIVPSVVRCPLCIVRERVYKEEVDKQSGIKRKKK
jgi:hypothetical protein